MSSGLQKINVSLNVRFLPQKLEYIEFNCSFPLLEDGTRSIVSKEFAAVFSGCHFEWCVINGTDGEAGN